MIILLFDGRVLFIRRWGRPAFQPVVSNLDKPVRLLLLVAPVSAPSHLDVNMQPDLDFVHLGSVHQQGCVAQSTNPFGLGVAIGGLTRRANDAGVWEVLGTV